MKENLNDHQNMTLQFCEQTYIRIPQPIWTVKMCKLLSWIISHYKLLQIFFILHIHLHFVTKSLRKIQQNTKELFREIYFNFSRYTNEHKQQQSTIQTMETISPNDKFLHFFILIISFVTNPKQKKTCVVH